MTDSGDPRVAVYIDFDNIVLSRYDQVHGRHSWQRDKARGYTPGQDDSDLGERLARARVDVGAIIDYASSFGTLVLTRAYADWSAPVNADYRHQLVGRAVDLVQLFPAAAYAKNGADIRLAVDAVEDMFRLPDLTHVVIVAGDSDYIALAQRCKRLGRYVVGIGVAGSTSKSLGAACDELVIYDALPGVEPVPEAPRSSGGRRRGGRGSSSGGAAETPTVDEPATDAPEIDATGTDPRSPVPTFTAPSLPDDPDDEPVVDAQAVATQLLERALQLSHEKDDAEWLHSSIVKNQMKRMDPSFSEKSLGFRSFSDFVRSRGSIAELDESSTARLVRLVRI